MKNIAIGDIHGRRIWKKIVEKEKDADLIVFVGDYFDTHENVSAMVQITNFNEIIEYKKANPDKVILLMGNHDFHYMSMMGEAYSGYNAKYASDIEAVVLKALALKHLQNCYIMAGIIFTHAGVTKSWAEDNQIPFVEFSKAEEHHCWELEEAINNIQAEAFKFYRKDQSGYGENIHQSPIWVRPESLFKDALPGWRQIVGHTTMPHIEIGNPLVFIDALGAGQYLEILDDDLIVKNINTSEGGDINV